MMIIIKIQNRCGFTLHWSVIKESMNMESKKERNQMCGLLLSAEATFINEYIEEIVLVS